MYKKAFNFERKSSYRHKNGSACNCLQFLLSLSVLLQPSSYNQSLAYSAATGDYFETRNKVGFAQCLYNIEMFGV